MIAFQGSRDNMSIEIVTFPGAPAVSEEAVKREAELDARIETLVKGTITLTYQSPQTQKVIFYERERVRSLD